MKPRTPLKAIRQHCLDCSCGSAHEVKLCVVTDCQLYPFRFGKNPNRKGIGNKQAVIPKIDGEFGKSALKTKI